ncbi:MAG: hypothetical protein MIO93_12845 [ANME-2 cluster archaeon]|jgi:hypothetical protein|nr:hypothetical protein [ANME-2 cluster archaeon]
MADGEIIEKIASIDEQVHDLRKMVFESGSRIKEEEIKLAARAWLTEAKKVSASNLKVTDYFLKSKACLST